MGEVTISVVIATFGDPSWISRAENAAVSVHDQTHAAHSIHLVHDQTLAAARNRGAADATGTHLVFLDADDELDAGYLAAMHAAGDIDIGRPNSIGMYPDGTIDDAPSMIPWADLRRRNSIVVSAMVRRSMFLAVGGFTELPALEDWHLWRRLWEAGADVVDVPDAILRIMVRPTSRNLDRDAQNRAYSRVIRETPVTRGPAR